MTKSSTVEKFFRIHLISLSLLLYQKMIPCTSANCKKIVFIRTLHGITPLPPGQTPGGVLFFPAPVLLSHSLVAMFFPAVRSSSLFVRTHTLLCNQKDASADYKDCTYYVEDCGTHATGFWKISTLLIYDIRTNI